MNSRDDILTSVQILFRPGNVVEVRAIGDNSMASGYFDDPEKLADKVEITPSHRYSYMETGYSCIICFLLMFIFFPIFSGLNSVKFYFYPLF